VRFPYAHQNETRLGQNPTHPQGDRPLDPDVAEYLTRRYFERTGNKQVVFNNDDRLCRTCYDNAKAHILKSPMCIGKTPVRRSVRIAKLTKTPKNRRYDKKSSSTESSSESSDSGCEGRREIPVQEIP
jgi:hypothetical protein